MCSLFSVAIATSLARLRGSIRKRSNTKSIQVLTRREVLVESGLVLRCRGDIGHAGVSVRSESILLKDYPPGERDAVDERRRRVLDDGDGGGVPLWGVLGARHPARA